MELARTIPRVVLDQRHAHGQTFEQHLVNTAKLLEDFGMSEIVQLGGLFHSIYGTASFKPVAAVARSSVVEAAGVLAERLAFLFCSCDRSTLFTKDVLTDRRTGEVLSNSPGVIEMLRIIEVANLYEQKCLYKGTPQWHFAKRFKLE